MKKIELWDGEVTKASKFPKLRGKLNTLKLSLRNRKERKDDERVAGYLRL